MQSGSGSHHQLNHAKESKQSDHHSLQFSRRGLERQVKTANKLVRVAQDGYRCSFRIYESTSLLRIAALNVFIKTEKQAKDGNNIFAPVSLEFMTMVEKYGRLTKEFCDDSIKFVENLVDFIKNLRRYHIYYDGAMLSIDRLLTESGVGWQPGALGEMLAILKTGESAGGGANLSEGIANRLLHYSPGYRNFLTTLSNDLVQLRKTYDRLVDVVKELWHISSVGEYAAQLAEIEATRSENREDLTSAFGNIYVLLKSSVSELDRMRSSFNRASELVMELRFEG